MFCPKLTILSTLVLLSVTMVTRAQDGDEPTADDVTACKKMKENLIDMLTFYNNNLFDLGARWVSNTLSQQQILAII